MQESSIVLYNETGFLDNKSYNLTWYDCSYGNGWLYGEQILSSEEGSYDDSYYLTYDEVDNYASQPRHTDGEANQDDRDTDTPYNRSRTWLEDYFGSNWGQNDGHSDEGYGIYGSNFEREESPLYDGDKNHSCYSYNEDVQPDYTENQWTGFTGFGFGDDEIEDHDIPYHSCWDGWEEMISYESIFGY